MPRRSRVAALGTAVALAVAGIGLADLVGAGSVGAATVTPAAPTGAHVTAVSNTALTVAVRTAAHATGYRVFASTTRTNVYIANIAKARTSAISRTPRMTIGSLTYTTATYYYRVETLNGRRYAFEPGIHAVSLRPYVPSALKAVTSTGSLYLTWSTRAVTGFAVRQATNSAMTAGGRQYSIQGQTGQFTPYPLVKGVTYWFQVRALNQTRLSAWTPAVRAVAPTTQHPLTLMTYNILEGWTAGTTEGGTVLPAWEQRRAGVVALIHKADPDVLAVQEGADWVGPTTDYVRQVDDLVQALGGAYDLAATEPKPPAPGWHRTANYILYKAAAYEAAGAGGHWDIGDGHVASYQLLRRRSTGAGFLAISTHLAVGNGPANDTLRQQETQRMLDAARPVAAAAGVPVVYAGDYNSDINQNHAFDGPGNAMRAARVADASNVAQSQTNAQYNSANQYLRTPPAYRQSVDYIYAGPGVAVQNRSMVMTLVNGRFVGTIPSDHNPVVARLYC
jgi:endonuclease/exonuclease/phosphatase family metal-dependent hydrolase